MTYYLLKLLTRIIQIFPLWFHYFISDILFIIVYYIIRYRRKVVITNLANSFPEKSLIEREKIERKFYHHFCDCIVEILYFDHISKNEILKRHTFINPSLATQYLEQGRHVILVMGHYNNGEWNQNWPLFSNKFKNYVIYKILKNKSFDRFFYELRSRFGVIPLEKANTFRQLYTDASNNEPTFSIFLIDQSPRINEIQYWTTFLNQDTPVLTGTEKMAKKLNAVVIFCHTRKIKRGYNSLEMTLITDQAKDTAPFELTEKGTRMLEESIIEKPEYWLWTHKRWKHKRETI